MTITRPLLAATLTDPEKIKFPVMVSPKLDGIRILKVDGKILTRSFKPLPNLFVRNILEKILPDGIDGELLMGDIVAEDYDDGSTIINLATFNETQSAMMRQEGKPEFVFCGFDYVVEGKIHLPFKYRYDHLVQSIKYIRKNEVEMGLVGHMRLVAHTTVNSISELMDMESIYIDQGYEGLMIRSLDGVYKCGRSTEKEGILLKLKKFEDSEAEIIGFEEKMTNNNVKEKDAFGKAKRSSKKEGLVPAGTLGALLVRDIHNGKEFSIGSGFDDCLKADIWENQDEIMEKRTIVKYKFQPSGGKDLPRFPVFLGFRSELDL